VFSRVDLAAIFSLSRACGRRLSGCRRANKDDRHSIKVFDPSIKGETDRFAYRFVKT